jgi:5-hydroxyisourate hydrolase
MATLSTHVLDTARGHPAAGLSVTLARRDGDGWVELGTARTDADGRVSPLGPPDGVVRGDYRLRFDTGAWFAAQRITGFYPEALIVFTVADDTHHHVPLLLSPYGLSTYRGS